MSLYGKIIDLQMLQNAWKNVRKNKPAAGIDGVSCEEFDNNKTEELKALNRELAAHTYKCRPVKQVVLYNEQKERTIALYSMRDKVVQQSLAQELTKLFSGTFSDHAYAYRENKSALSAIGDIERYILDQQPARVLKADIQHYFDTIQWAALEQKLRSRIREEDVIRLIQAEAAAPTVDWEGNICAKTIGIHQGSSIAPVLSNIYLTEFDHWIENKCPFYVRYSDDMVMFGDLKEELQELLKEAQTRLQVLGLALSEKKTGVFQVVEGFEYLGYYFDSHGKAITSKAEGQLASQLESVWLLNRNDTFEIRMKKMSEILNGWEQYFRGDRIPGDILEYVTALYTLRLKGKATDKLPDRAGYVNFDKEIMEYLITIWENEGRKDQVLLEYEQFYGTFNRKKEYSEEQTDALLAAFAEVRHGENEETLTELMQLYSDLHLYNQAEHIGEKIQALEEEPEKKVNIPNTANIKIFGYSEEVVRKYITLFVGREDLYADISVIDGKKHSEQVLSPLGVREIRSHLRGERMLATYNQRQNATVHYMVLDLDVSRKVILESRKNSKLFQAAMEEAGKAVQEIRKWFRQKGLNVRIEYSGERGYHVWLFFEQWIPTYYCNLLQDYMEPEFRKFLGNDLTLEYFPNKTRLKGGKPGQNLKLPLAVHEAAHIHSFLLNDDLTVNENLEQWMDDTPKYSLTVIKKILSYQKPKNLKQQMKIVNTDLSNFGELTPNVREILSKCNLMRYLARKAYDTGYLTHFERLSMLYVFGHVGDDGKQFLHRVMGYTLNYKYNVTEKFIRRCPEKPISCLKLRDQYKSITAEIGCSCIFRRNDRCYPSPVLHAIALSQQDSDHVTLPISRTVSREKSKEIADHLNIHSRSQALALKIVEFKKQERGIKRAIRKNEKELEQIFNEEHIDSLELEMGILVRKKTEAGWEWSIEL